ncbi:MAG: stage II sporulation protein D [Clostridia bacterium]|nr:stage II sporulation protein D [Clostridia bacterium]
MKLTVILALIALVIALAFPLILAGTSSTPQTEPTAVSTPEPAAAEADDAFSFTVLTDGEVKTVTLSEWLPGVLAGEMPVLFESEALKAQAVSARTFIIYRCSNGVPAHPEADICDDAACCAAHITEDELREKWGDDYEEYWAKIVAAVEATDGEHLTYEGQTIQAVFHSSSPGFTENSSALWDGLPYLVSVSSPETETDVPGYVTEVEVSVSDFASSLRAAGIGADLSGTPDLWVGDLVLDESGRVASALIGGTAVGGAELREIFSLRSTAFTLEYIKGAFLFTVTGYGHGVGMSQYGANVMAQNGSSYAEILQHYYPGTHLSG